MVGRSCSHNSHLPSRRGILIHTLPPKQMASIQYHAVWTTKQKTNQNPQVSTLISHLRVLIWAKGCDQWHSIEIILYYYTCMFYKLKNTFRKQKLLFLYTHAMYLVLNSALIPAVTEPSKL
jgi:hypothetical protein